MRPLAEGILLRVEMDGCVMEGRESVSELMAEVHNLAAGAHARVTTWMESGSHVRVVYIIRWGTTTFRGAPLVDPIQKQSVIPFVTPES